MTYYLLQIVWVGWAELDTSLWYIFGISGGGFRLNDFALMNDTSTRLVGYLEADWASLPPFVIR